MRFIYFIILCILVIPLPLNAQVETKIELTAQEILARVDRIFDYPEGLIKGKMVHITPDGRTREIDLTASITPEDYLFRFSSSDRGEEMRILYNLRGEDIWVYQVLALKLFNKRSVDKFRPILNVNFFYIDLSNADLQSNYNAHIKGDAFIKGIDTYRLVLDPLDKTSEYGMLTLYAAKSDFIPLRIDYHDTSKVIFKTLTVSKVIRKGDRIIPVRYDMLHIENGTVTLLEFFSFEEDMKFDKNIFRHQNLGEMK